MMKRSPTCYVFTRRESKLSFPDRLRRRYKEWKNQRKNDHSVAELKKAFKVTYEADVKASDYSITDFERLTNIGKGSFGKVELVRNRKTSQLSALKIINMNSIEDDTSHDHLMREKRILSSIRHPFIVTLRSHFKDESRLYFEMEYYPGGDLFSYVQKNGKCSGIQARFYGAQILMAIEFMHSIGIVHRDLKPDNIMLNHDGYLKIVDFGFATKVTKDGMSTLCGTPRYMAPELYLINASSNNGQKYYDTVEWWTYGVIMYTLITGKEPFRENSFRNSVKIIAGVVFYPLNLPSIVKRFLEGLLQPAVHERLGCGKKGSKEIRNHEWFDGTDWVAIFKKEVEAPYVPKCPVVDNLTRNGSKSGDISAYRGDYVFALF